MNQPKRRRWKPRPETTGKNDLELNQNEAKDESQAEIENDSEEPGPSTESSGFDSNKGSQGSETSSDYEPLIQPPIDNEGMGNIFNHHINFEDLDSTNLEKENLSDTKDYDDSFMNPLSEIKDDEDDATEPDSFEGLDLDETESGSSRESGFWGRLFGNRKRDNQKKSNKLIYEPDRLYVFFYGTSGTGKTLMLSSLIYFLAKSEEIILEIDNEMEDEAKRKYYGMINSVKSGGWLASTAAIKSGETVKELKMVIKPHLGLNDLKVSFIDLAGEDLEQLLVTKQDTAGRLDTRIQAYLEHVPPANLLFIPLLPADDPDPHDEVISQFMNYLRKYKLEEAMVLLTSTKWDLVDEGLVGKTLKELTKYHNLTHTNQLLAAKLPNLSTMEFSVGEVDPYDSSRFKHDEHYALRLARAIYRLGHGNPVDPWVKVGQPKKKSWISNIISKLNGEN